MAMAHGETREPAARDSRKSVGTRSVGTINALRRGLQMLETIGDAGRLRLTLIADRMQLNLSTAHHMVKTLHEFGYLVQDENREYRLSPRVFKLAASAWDADQLGHAAVSAVAELALVTGETSHVAVFDRGDAVIILSRIEGNGSANLVERVGAARGFHCTALGKVLMAYQPEEVQNHHLAGPLKVFTRKTVTNPNRLRDALRLAREQGYAMDDEEYTIGTRCIAAPVFNYSGMVAAAIAVHGNLWSITDQRIPELVRIVREKAAQLSAELGFMTAQSIATRQKPRKRRAGTRKSVRKVRKATR